MQPFAPFLCLRLLFLLFLVVFRMVVIVVVIRLAGWLGSSWLLFRLSGSLRLILLIGCSLLWLLCSGVAAKFIIEGIIVLAGFGSYRVFSWIPLLLIGPATTAAFSITLRMVDEEEGYIAKPFLKAYRENFKDGMIVGVIVCLGYNKLYFELKLPNGTVAQILDVMDYISNNCLMPMVALLTCILIGWVVKPKVIIDEVTLGGYRFGREKLYVAMIKVIAPLMLLILLVQSVGL